MPGSAAAADAPPASGVELMAALWRGALRVSGNRSTRSSADNPSQADALRLT